MFSALLLSVIWWTSVALVTMSIVAMILMIMRRFRIERGAAWWGARKKKMVARLLSALDEADPMLLDWSDFTKVDLRLAHEILYDMAGLIRGGYQESLTALLEAIGGREAGIAQLCDARENTRIQAASNLALFKGDDVIEALRGALSDESAHVRLAAAAALNRIGSAISLHDLLQYLDPNTIVRSRRMRELFRKVGGQSIPQLMDLLVATDSVPLRLLVIDALGANRVQEALDLIMAQASSADVDVRAEALRALATIGHPSAVPVVVQGLSDVAWEVRTQAAVCAGRIGLPATIPALTALLDDDKWWVRFRAAQSLFSMKDEGRKIITAAAEGTGYSLKATDIASLVMMEQGAA